MRLEGTWLEPYEIISRVGAGGMGEVCGARATRLDRTVAIKVLPPDLTSDPAARQPFAREAREYLLPFGKDICSGRAASVWELPTRRHFGRESLAPPLARATNIRKRLLVHVGGFNLGLLMRQLMGVGTPRGLQGRLVAALGAVLALVWTLRRHLERHWPLGRRISRLECAANLRGEPRHVAASRWAFTTRC